MSDLPFKLPFPADLLHKKQTPEDLPNLEILQTIVSSGVVDLNDTSSIFKGLNLPPLTIACYYGWDTVVKMLIDAGADVNRQESRYNYTPIFFAVANHFTVKVRKTQQIIKMLLNAGADVNHKCGSLANELAGKTVLGVLEYWKATNSTRELKKRDTLMLFLKKNGAVS